MRPFDLAAAQAGALFTHKSPRGPVRKFKLIGSHTDGRIVFESVLDDIPDTSQWNNVYNCRSDEMVMLPRTVTKWRWVKDSGFSLSRPFDTEADARAYFPAVQAHSYVSRGQGIPHLAKIEYDV